MDQIGRTRGASQGLDAKAFFGVATLFVAILATILVYAASPF